MTKISHTPAELKSMLEEQIDFLRLSSDAYDRGFDGEIKRLAAACRVLFHDTPKSISLLMQLGMKDLDFIDTGIPFDEGNLLSHSSLVQYHHTKVGPIPKAHLDDGFRSVRVRFDLWWDGIVFVDKERNEFSRKDIVLTLANKQGGSHVDPQIDEKYSNLRKRNTLGWFVVFGDGREVPGADQVPAAMRQIAHEALKTLNSGYVCKHPPSPDTLMISMGGALHQADRPPSLHAHNLRATRPTLGGSKIGRNDLCHCGSGEKYKHCCIDK